MNGFFFGVATKTCLDQTAVGWYVGQYGQSWAYEGASGVIYHNGGTTPYGGTYRAGDKIGVSVGIYKNGSNLPSYFVMVAQASRFCQYKAELFGGKTQMC